MTKTIDIVLAGICGYGATYLNALLDAPEDRGVRIVGAADPAARDCPRLEELRQRGASIHETLEDFYTSRSADLAVISAPIHWHAPLSILALRNGSHVLCEKPLAGSVEDGRAMIAAAREAGRFLAIGYQWSFAEATQRLKAAIMAGDFGAPRFLKTLVLWPRNTAYYGRAPWAGRQYLDGRAVFDSPVNNAVSHYLHHMLYVLGPSRESATRVTSVAAELYRANPIENHDTAAIRAHTDSGTEVLFYASHAVPHQIGPVFRYEFDDAIVQGQDATWLGDRNGDFLVSARFRSGEVRPLGNPNLDMTRKLWGCVEAARGNATAPACNAETALSQTVCVEAALESSGGVRQFPADIIHDDQSPEGVTWVRGLIPVFMQCYDQAILPSEHGAFPGAAACSTATPG